MIVRTQFLRCGTTFVFGSLCVLLGICALKPARADLLDVPKVNAKSEEQLRSAWVSYRAGDMLGLPAKINAALQTAREAHDVSGEAGILLVKATLSRMAGRKDRADEVEAQAESLMKTLTMRARLSIYFGAGLALREGGFTPLGQVWIDKGTKEAEASDDVRSQAQAVHLQGLFVWESSDAKAKVLWQQAVPLWRQCGDNAGLAWSLMRLGMIARAWGEGPEELRLLQEARTAAQRGDKNDIKARASSEIMFFYESKGDMARAHDFGIEALGFSEKDASPLVQVQRSIVLQELTRIAARQHRPEEVAKFGDEGRALAHGLGRKRSEVQFVTTLASAHLNLGQVDLALKDVDEGLALVGDGNWLAGTKEALQNTQFTVEGVAGHRERALQIADALPDTTANSTVKAVAAEMRGDFGGAIQKWTQWLDDAEWRRSKMGDLTNAKIGYLAERRQDYGRLTDLLLRSGRSDEAFNWIEKMHGRALLDVMDGGRATSDKNLSGLQKENKATLSQQLSRASARLLSLQMDENAPTEKVEEAKTAAGEASRAFESLMDEIAAGSPALAATAHTLTVAELGKVLPPDTALVEFAFVDGGELPTPVHRLIAFVARSDGKTATVRAIPLEATRDELTESVGDLAGACADPKKSFRLKARELDRLLLEPLKEPIGDAKRLLVCPEGPLWNAPFAAFMDADGKYAVQRWELVLGFGTTTALQPPVKAERTHAPQELLIVANPAFGGPGRLVNAEGEAKGRALVADSRSLTADSRALTADSRDGRGGVASAILTREGTIRPLPGTEREAKAIGADFPGAHILQGAAASESEVEAQMGNFRVVHFATHGLFNDADPLGSSLVLAAPAKNAREDGFLTAREIFDLDLKADLVVMSACNTGQGQNRDGEGVLGLTWALTAAGAKAQVVSGWSVDDDATAQLMTSFYGRLKKGEARGAALRGAMVEFQSDPVHAHPFYWAPFSLLGDWR